MVILIDTREQRPLCFDAFKDVTTKRREVWPGDYTVQVGSAYLALERKSVSDLIGTMKGGYAGFGASTPKRFDRELMALSSIVNRGGIARLIVEPDDLPAAERMSAYDQIVSHRYRSEIPPKTVLAFILAISHGWGVPVDLTESREHSAQLVHDLAVAAVQIRRGKLAVEKAVSAAEKNIKTID